MSVIVGSVHVLCPVCGNELPIVVSGELVTGEDDNQYLACEPDMTDLWAHKFTHEEVTDG